MKVGQSRLAGSWRREVRQCASSAGSPFGRPSAEGPACTPRPPSFFSYCSCRLGSKNWTPALVSLRRCWRSGRLECSRRRVAHEARPRRRTRRSHLGDCPGRAAPRRPRPIPARCRSPPGRPLPHGTAHGGRASRSCTAQPPSEASRGSPGGAHHPAPDPHPGFPEPATREPGGRASRSCTAQPANHGQQTPKPQGVNPTSHARSPAWVTGNPPPANPADVLAEAAQPNQRTVGSRLPKPQGVNLTSTASGACRTPWMGHTLRRHP